MLKPILIILILGTLFLIAINPIFAAVGGGEIETMLGKAAGPSYGTSAETNLSVIVGKVISALLAFLGTIFLVLIIYGGFLWMTAGGNEEQIKKARGIITQATIGLIIVLAAYAITYYIVEKVKGAAL
ncbi:MAG: hypothetical protein COX43_00405 [Parcubacteria group bacterium CG23_combo_of_CG06-09_8_20_14_all_35_9]|nr:MAG: hypothetical protein COX43_00405 [Parcubacteria group bacterium CG23_combo_of_CG06-09_8_20_14_all_35_9]